MARGAFPDSHDLCVGMPGMHGNYTAVTAMQRADLLIAMGARFDDRVTGRLDGFAPEAKIVHVDIDAAELGKVRNADVAVHGDCKLVMVELMKELQSLGMRAGQTRNEAWLQQVKQWQARYPLTYQQSSPGEFSKPQYVLEVLRDSTPDDTIVTSGGGTTPNVGPVSTGDLITLTHGLTLAVLARWVFPYQRL